jgi:hypothetical protein
MSATNAFERLTLKCILRGEAISGFTPWLGLSFADPTEDGSGILEPSYTKGYFRVNLLDSDGSGNPAWTEAVIDASNGEDVRNTAEIIFEPATQHWGILTHWFISTDDGDVGDSVLAYGALTTPREVIIGERVRFSIDSFSITAD